MKRKIILSILTVTVILSFSGCQSRKTVEIPSALKENTSPVLLSIYSPKTILNNLNSDNEEVIPIAEKTFPFEVPDNYRNLFDYVFAILNDNSEITGYKIAVQKNENTWEWKDCDVNGNLSEEPKTEPVTSNKPKPQKPTSSNKNEPTTSAPIPETTTSAPPTEPAFKWSIISQSSCPLNVSNAFDKYIVKGQSATCSMTSGGNTYALVKAPAGQGVKIHSVSETGVLTYSFVNEGENYVIVMVNRSVGINFSKK